VEADMWSFSPVLGFRPSRADLSTILKLPKPISEIESPFSKAEEIPSRTALIISPAAFCLLLPSLKQTSLSRLFSFPPWV
jgi:hypothetical protein